MGRAVASSGAHDLTVDGLQGAWLLAKVPIDRLERAAIRLRGERGELEPKQPRPIRRPDEPWRVRTKGRGRDGGRAVHPDRRQAVGLTISGGLEGQGLTVRRPSGRSRAPGSWSGSGRRCRQRRSRTRRGAGTGSTGRRASMRTRWGVRQAGVRDAPPVGRPRQPLAEQPRSSGQPAKVRSVGSDRGDRRPSTLPVTRSATKLPNARWSPSGAHDRESRSSPETLDAGRIRAPGPPATGATQSSTPSPSGLNQATRVPSGEARRTRTPSALRQAAPCRPAAHRLPPPRGRRTPRRPALRARGRLSRRSGTDRHRPDDRRSHRHASGAYPRVRGRFPGR